MYAAVKAGREGLLISNDEMRDHIFQLLAPKFFYKWKQARAEAPPTMCNVVTIGLLSNGSVLLSRKMCVEEVQQQRAASLPRFAWPTM